MMVRVLGLFIKRVKFFGRSGQASSLDFIVGLVIIVSTLVIGAQILSGNSFVNRFDKLESQAIVASDVLLSEGYPVDWNESSVLRPGLLSSGSLNLSKLSLIINLSVNDYDRFRSLLVDDAQLFVYFRNSSGIINLSGSCGFGSPEVVVGPSCSLSFPESDDKVFINRLVVFNNSIVNMVVSAWY